MAPLAWVLRPALLHPGFCPVEQKCPSVKKVIVPTAFE